MSTRHSTSNERRRNILDTLAKIIGPKEIRKMKRRHAGNQTAWFWLGMFGLVGWSIAIPTLLGIALGVWIDTTWPSRFSWTLMLLTGGVILGCVNAWFWIKRESR